MRYIKQNSKVDEMLCLTPEQVKAEMEAAYELSHLAVQAYERATRRWQVLNRWCASCRWWIQDGFGFCGCKASPFYTDVVEDEHTCDHWEYDNDEAGDTAGVSGAEASKGE